MFTYINVDGQNNDDDTSSITTVTLRFEFKARSTGLPVQIRFTKFSLFDFDMLNNGGGKEVRADSQMAGRDCSFDRAPLGAVC